MPEEPVTLKPQKLPLFLYGLACFGLCWVFGWFLFRFSQTTHIAGLLLILSCFIFLALGCVFFFMAFLHDKLGTLTISQQGISIQKFKGKNDFYWSEIDSFKGRRRSPGIIICFKPELERKDAVLTGFFYQGFNNQTDLIRLLNEYKDKNT